MNAGWSTTKRGAKSQRRKGGTAFSTNSLPALGCQRADYEESSSENKAVRPVPVRKERPVFSKACEEPGAKSKPTLKTTRTSNDAIGTFLLFDENFPLSITVFVASKDIPSYSARLPMFYLAACRQSPVSEHANTVAVRNGA